MNPDRDHVDPAIDALLRAHSAEMPPAELDATILAAARRAVQSAPRKAESNAEATRPWRWWMPLAAAATIGAITIGVLQLAPKRLDATSEIVSDAPPVVALPAQPIAPPAVPAEKNKAEAATEAPRAKVRTERAPAPEPFPAAKDKPSREFAGNAAGTVQRSAAAPTAPAATAKSALADASARSAAEWIERIRALVTEGKLAEAAQELTAFRAAYGDADARLPAELQAWAATVKR
jgi:hypothetical protein